MDMEIDGIRCHYIQEGTGRDILLLHGWGGCIDSWLPVTNHLKTKCRVTVLDFPGHGQSGFPPDTGWAVKDYCAFTLKFMDRVGLTRCDIVAHSFGGRVMLMLAAEHPERVGRLLLTGCAGLIPTRGLEYYIKMLFVKLFKALTHLLPNGAAIRERLGTRFGSADYKALSPAMRTTFTKVVNQDLFDYLERIKAETLLIFGTEDTATPIWMGRTMEKMIPGSALIEFEGAGHFAYLERNAQFLKIMDAFFFPEKQNEQ